MKNIDDNYITVQGWMLSALNLKGNDLLLFALIYGFCQDDKSCFSGSISYIETWLNVSRPTAIAALAKLTEAGWIIRSETSGLHPNEYRVNSENVKEARHQLVKKLYQTSKESLPVDSKETLPNNTSIYNNNRESAPAQNSDLNTYPSRNASETANNPTAYLSAIELFKSEAAAAKLTYPAAFLEPYFLHKQQKGDFYGISAPVGETDTRRWLSKHYAGLQAWAQRQPQFDRHGPQVAQEKPVSLSFSIKK